MRHTRKIWAELIRQYEKSGLSAEEFATKRGIPAKTLQWWKWKLRHEAEDPPSLVPVRVISSGSPSASRCEPSSAAVEVMLVRFAGGTTELISEVVNRLRQC